MDPFTYERVKEHTGKVQFRVNGPSAGSVAGRRVVRGEVLAFAKPEMTSGLVATGNFAHVPADTPIGPPAATEPPEPGSVVLPAPPAPGPDDGITPLFSDEEV